MKYAIIQTGGKQYRVSEGDVLEVERLTARPATTMTFSDVLLYVSDGDVQIGMPVVKGMTVQAEVLADVRGEKIRVTKFKAKARYRRTTGHRQALSQVKITQIGAEKAKVVAPKEEKEAPVKKTETAKKIAAPKK